MLIIVKFKIMKKKLFIGIDVSKKKLDVSFHLNGDLNQMKHFIVSNNEKGFKQFIGRIKELTDIEVDSWLICFENTGVYSMGLALFLSEMEISFCEDSSLRIKRSLGIKREKNDKLDSKQIAEYAYLFQAKLKLTVIAKKELKQLKVLLSYRERLQRQKHALEVSSKEGYAFFQNETTKFVLDDSRDLIDQYEQKIKNVEAEIDKLIRNDAELKTNYKMATSVVGIGLIITSYMLVQTNNFTSFNPREYACHAGVAPFENSSGTSMPQQGKTSKMANKKIKALLTSGAQSAVQHDPQLKLYYRRKINEGKNQYCALNAVRFKLIARVFATVKRGTPYVKMAH
jgi:transposase